MRKYICSLIVFISIFTIMHSIYGFDEDRPNNPKFKNWCIETFEYGESVYEAYKKITFGIDFTLELDKNDIWQTPFETLGSKKGDCEDVAFLFLDYLSMSQDNAEIVWGFIVKNGDDTARRHVWCELTGRDGEKYAVEGFTRSWRGIIPMKKGVWRYSVLRMSSNEFNRLSYLFFASVVNEWNIKVCTDYSGVITDEIQVIDGGYMTYGHGKPTNEIIFWKSQPQSPKFLMLDLEFEINYLFEKLHVLFTECHKGE
ncbi:MAG: hypothetical protein QGH26_00895 [Candidatus Pacebacteria bacterium]|nr:hypothetical protein [Parcubacteria group bacterium]MDP6249380.1 hypothetical protein [Candidatus Paceibacterota bacterium]MDP7368095.1 hypothetical protein [Candidatus Paceibacterota bacterium]